MMPNLLAHDPGSQLDTKPSPMSDHRTITAIVYQINRAASYRIAASECRSRWLRVPNLSPHLEGGATALALANVACCGQPNHSVASPA
jgi:hypothetical protein